MTQKIFSEAEGFEFFSFQNCHFAFSRHNDGSMKGIVVDDSDVNIYTFTYEGARTNALHIKEERPAVLLMQILLDTVPSSFAVPCKAGGYNLYLPVSTGVYACMGC